MEGSAMTLVLIVEDDVMIRSFDGFEVCQRIRSDAAAL